ncbi:MAG: aminodeoxychorismate synthase component I [Acidimicrobiales bacterium]
MDKSPSAVLRSAAGDARPFALVGAWSGGHALVGSEPLLVAEDADDPFAVLDEQPAITATVPGATGGGWVGYLGYGLARLVERLPASPPRPVPVPSSILAFYDHLLARDDFGRWWFEALWSKEQEERLESRLSEWQRRAREPEAGKARFECGSFLPSPDAENHLVLVARAIEHIRSGDVFQVNVCTRLEAEFTGDPIELFCAGADRLSPRYGAFLGHPSLAVASFSPELFLKRRVRQVLSSPIKGTARRQGQSATSRDQLVGSGKDRAENLMIVDLVRNDLGRVCRYGSVKVPELYRVEKHPGVWHLVSDVSGELSDGVSDAELLRATFPPGSVTGAPKVRAMELVTELEGTAREVYTGAVGIASPVTGLELNVAIRTFELSDGKVWLGVGGGVVADSELDRELEECFDKARPLLAAIGAELGPAPRHAGGGVAKAAVRSVAPPLIDPGAGVFETILVLGGQPVELESHLGRLTASVSRLYGSYLSPGLAAEVIAVAASRTGPHRLRVRVYPCPTGALGTDISISAAPEAFSGSTGPGVRLVPVTLPGGLGRHKWHDRAILSDRHESVGLGAHDQLLLVDEDGAVLESELANVFAVLRGVVRTPPVDGRILAGTTREAAIRLARAAGFEVSDQALTIIELASAEEVFLTSSIRGVRAVRELSGGRSFELGPITTRIAKALWASWNCAVAGIVAANVHDLARPVPYPTGTASRAVQGGKSS